MEILDMRIIEIKNATHKELRAHYSSTVVLRTKFDLIRPNFYETTGKPLNYDPLAEDYKRWLLEEGLTTMVIKESIDGIRA
jgi:hypothetical protein